MNFLTAALSEVTKVRVTHRLQTNLTIEWDKLNNNSIYNYILRQNGRDDILFTGSKQHDVISYELSRLTPGTVYEFTLFTVVKDTNSTGNHFKSVTSKLIYV